MKCIILKCILKCISSNCKSPQDVDFSEIELFFRFVVCLLFYFVIKMWELLAWEIFAKNHIENMANSNKIIQKILQCSNMITQNE